MICLYTDLDVDPLASLVCFLDLSW